MTSAGGRTAWEWDYDEEGKRTLGYIRGISCGGACGKLRTTVLWLGV